LTRLLIIDYIYLGEIMAISQGKSTRSPSGARNVANRGKRKSELGRDPAETRVDEKRLRKIRTRGGNEKLRLATANKINLTDVKSGKTQVTDILGVIENDANPNYVRRNIITKGAVVETPEGNAKVTSRPGQDGVVNGILI
jgi:small subunit ribosomal protein S8e